MEKKFEEKFGLNTEEMSEILGGIVGPVTCDCAGSCESGCMLMCNTCVGCSTECMGCKALFAIA